MTYNKTSLRPSVRSRIVDRDYMAHVARWSYAARLVERRNRALTRPYVIIDVGCGVEAPFIGVLASGAYLARGRPLSYHGVDVGPIEPVASPRWARFYPRVDVLKWTPPERGDLVACFEVIEHMPRDSGLELLSVLRRLVREDGVVLLSTPVADLRSLPRNHVYEWGLDELSAACCLAGFSVQRTFGTFMDVDDLNRAARKFPSIAIALSRLCEYYSNEALSALFAPLFPEMSKSIMLVLRPEAYHGAA